MKNLFKSFKKVNEGEFICKLDENGNYVPVKEDTDVETTEVKEVKNWKDSKIIKIVGGVAGALACGALGVAIGKNLNGTDEVEDTYIIEETDLTSESTEDSETFEG